MAATGGCAFCAIVRGEAEAAVVLETPEVVAFLDRRPLFPGHVLVVPREHVETLPDVAGGLLAALMGQVQRLSAAVPVAFGAQGTFVAMNNRVSQSVPHLHVHVVPRTKGDGLRGFFWPRHRYGDGEMEAGAERLRAVLDHAPSDRVGGA
ncbi:MAG TPA: HIT family protein [Dermatophilaceae bacterium]|nr:HIT family protein [Dermatophilaceae bacterium]